MSAWLWFRLFEAFDGGEQMLRCTSVAVLCEQKTAMVVNVAVTEPSETLNPDCLSEEFEHEVIDFILPLESVKPLPILAWPDVHTDRAIERFV